MNEESAITDWYYSPRHQSGQPPVGPLTWEQLVGVARAGRLSGDDWVWHPSLPGWLPAATVEGLGPAPSSPGQRPVSPGAPAAPEAQAASTPEFTPTASSTPPASGGKGIRSRLPWIIPIAAVVIVGLSLGLAYGLRDARNDRDPGASATNETSPSSLPPSTVPTDTSAPPSTTSGEPGTWLVMLYQDADDELLEQDIVLDLNEAELVGSTQEVTIVSQIDRYVGGYEGDGDVTSTKRYLVTTDEDIYTLNSVELSDLGEVDMGDGQSLYDFATWAIGSYPAQQYVLVMADHGGGWTGGWSDDDPENDSEITVHELDTTLGAIVADTGIGAFELVGFDACLMGQFEVMSAIAPHARYAVGSEEIEPGVGWAYAGFLRALTENPAMSGRELGQAVIDAYIVEDVRITDDEARAALTGGDYTVESVIADMSMDATMAVIDLHAMRDLNAALNQLAATLADADQALVARARTYAQAFTGIFGDDYPPSFIDLKHFVDLLTEDLDDPRVAQAAKDVQRALAEAVTAERHGEQRPASAGLSIYFPNSEEYAGIFAGEQAYYASAVGRFAAASLWDDFLTRHYTGEAFDPAGADIAVVTPEQAGQTDFTAAIEGSTPAPGADIVAPGTAQLAIAPLTASAGEVTSDGGVLLATEISGSNIAYVYYYVSYYWEEDGSYLTADAGYVEPGTTKEINGVYYPDWGQGDAIPVEYEWTPTLFFMSDGNPDNDQFAFFEPTVYSAETGKDIYTVRGTYTFVDTGTEVDAEIDFRGDGEMLGVWAFSDSGGETNSGTWHEIVPRPGDTFTITDEYLEFDQDPDGEFVDYYGGTMTFGDSPFTMVAYTAYTGSYALGIGVEDLDGQLTWDFVEIVVTE